MLVISVKQIYIEITMEIYWYSNGLITVNVIDITHLRFLF